MNQKNSLQYVHASFVLNVGFLSTRLEMCAHACWIEGKDHLPQCAGNALPVTWLLVMMFNKCSFTGKTFTVQFYYIVFPRLLLYDFLCKDWQDSSTLLYWRQGTNTLWIYQFAVIWICARPGATWVSYSSIFWTLMCWSGIRKQLFLSAEERVGKVECL